MAVLELRTWRAPVRFFLPVSMVRMESWSGVKPTAVSRAAILSGTNDWEGEEQESLAKLCLNNILTND